MYQQTPNRLLALADVCRRAATKTPTDSWTVLEFCLTTGARTDDDSTGAMGKAAARFYRDSYRTDPPKSGWAPLNDGSMVAVYAYPLSVLYAVAGR